VIRFGAFLAACAAILGAAPTSRPKAAATVVPSGWLYGNRIALTVSSRGGADSITYTFAIARNGDMRIQTEARSNGAESSGELLLISGRFLATRGADLPKGYEIDTVDAAALAWQIAGQLLERGAPGDPGSLRGPVRIQVVESRAPLHVSTTSADASYPPPWTARGHANPLGGGRVYFEIIFDCRSPVPPAEATEMKYSGTWERSAAPPEIDDVMSLAGWKVFTLGTIRRKDVSGEILDFGATPLAGAYATVGDLRRSAARPKK